MGSSQSQTHKTQTKSKILQDWEVIDHMSDYNIVKNKDSQIIGELKKFKLDSLYDISKELKIYNMRNSTNQPIVQAYAAQKIQKINKYQKSKKNTSSGLCGNNDCLAVVTERIPVRLSQLYQVTFPEAIYLLLQSLKGYKYLYPKSGPVHVTDQMVGLNQNGQCKVWINQDWSINHPNKQIKSLMSTRNLRLDRQYNLISPEYRDQKQMVQNIVDLVEDKCEAGKFPPDFGAEIKLNSRTFKSCQEFIQNYVRAKNIYIPSSIDQKVVRTSPHEMRNIQERYKTYLNDFRKQEINQNDVKQIDSYNQPSQTFNNFRFQNNTSNFNYNTSNQVNTNFSTNYNQYGLYNDQNKISTQNNNSLNSYGLHQYKRTDFIQPTNSLLYQNSSINTGNKPKVNFGANNY